MRLLRAMALAGATISLATASTALAADPGVSPDLTWGISHTQMDQQTAAMQQQGVKWVRLNVEWNAVEGTKGTYDSYMMGEYDHAVADAHNAGMKIVMLISNSPQWASGSTNKSMPPQNP